MSNFASAGGKHSTIAMLVYYQHRGYRSRKSWQYDNFLGASNQAEPRGTVRKLALDFRPSALGDARRAIWRGIGLHASSVGAFRCRFSDCPARPSLAENDMFKQMLERIAQL